MSKNQVNSQEKILDEMVGDYATLYRKCLQSAVKIKEDFIECNIDAHELASEFFQCAQDEDSDVQRQEGWKAIIDQVKEALTGRASLMAPVSFEDLQKALAEKKEDPLLYSDFQKVAEKTEPPKGGKE